MHHSHLKTIIICLVKIMIFQRITNWRSPGHPGPGEGDLLAQAVCIMVYWLSLTILFEYGVMALMETRFWILLKCEIHTYWHFVRSMQRSSVTRTETFKNSENPCRVWIRLKCEIDNYLYFIRPMQKKLRDTDGDIQK